MKTADALLTIADNEAVLILQADGTYSADKPMPAEVLEAINSAPEIAAEFMRMEFYPTPESLTHLLTKTRQPFETSYITARFTDWALIEALKTGKIEYACWDKKAGFAVRGWQAEYDSLRRLRGETDYFCYRRTCPKCGQLRIHTGYTHRSGAYVCSGCMDSHEFETIGDAQRLDEWSGRDDPFGRMKPAKEDKAPPAAAVPEGDTQMTNEQMNINADKHVYTCTDEQMNYRIVSHETRVHVNRRQQRRQRKPAVFSLLD